MDLSAAEKIVPVTPTLIRSGGNCSERSLMVGFGYGIHNQNFSKTVIMLYWQTVSW